MRKSLLTSAFVFALSTQATMADRFHPVDLDPITHAEAALVVVSPDGAETVYSPADLENYTTFRLTTTTPWREESADFEGVKLSEILKKHGLDRVESIRVTAENDFATIMNRTLLDEVEILVATRVDGHAHSRRARGPIQFVIDNETYETSPHTDEANLVWMAARIEAGG